MSRATTKSQWKKWIAKRYISFFCATYLPHHFKKPCGPHHMDLFRAINSPKINKRIVRAEPRRFGKSTIVSMAAPLWWLATQRKQFILLVGESSTTAQGNLQAIISELENNERLIRDFPHLIPKRDAKGQLTKWTDTHIVLKTGQTVVARGMGSSMRGLKSNATRPDVAILDDAESPENSDTYSKRLKHKQWFGGTFLGLGDAGWDVYIIGNLLHHDGLMAEHLKSQHWDSRVYQAINKPVAEAYPYPVGNRATDGSALWPEGWSLQDLENYKQQPTVGSFSFSREMMNSPISSEDQLFNPSEFTFFDLDHSGQYEEISTFIDPAGGANRATKSQDWCAIVTAGKSNGYIDILSCVLSKKTPLTQIDLLLNEYERWSSTQVVVEENTYKNLLGQNVTERGAKRGLLPNVRTIHQTKNKLTRILSLQPSIESGKVRFARHLLKQVPEYFNQWEELGSGSGHDDAPDATEGAVRSLERRSSFRPLN